MIRGYCGIGVWHPKTAVNIGTLWRSAFIYGAAFIFTVGRRYEKQASDTTASWRHIPLLHFDGLEPLMRHLPYSCPLVGVELDDRAVPLDEFAHPERACYLLGAEDHGLGEEVMAVCHHLVRIVTPRPMSLNVAVAGTLVLESRRRIVAGRART